MRLLALLLAGTTFAVLAQDQDLQRQLIQRQQQSDSFTLQLRQSQERLQVAPGDLKRQQEFDARQLGERQRLDAVSERQLRDVNPDAQIEPQLRSYERQNADLERQPLREPVKEVPVRPAPKAVPILPAQEGIRLEQAR